MVAAAAERPRAHVKLDQVRRDRALEGQHGFLPNGDAGTCIRLTEIPGFAILEEEDREWWIRARGGEMAS